MRNTRFIGEADRSGFVRSDAALDWSDEHRGTMTLLKSVRHFIGYHRILLSGAVVAVLCLFAAPTLPSILAGIPIILSGEGVRIWSSGCLTKNRALSRSGPYALIRHPLYLGNFLIAIGFSVTSGRAALVLLIAAAYGTIYYATIEEEEKALRERFGEEFEEYAGQVPRLIPLRVPFPRRGAGFRWTRVRDHREYKTWVAIGVLLAFMVFKSYYAA
jgi:protein-S-isoprenylcysteine O-methyltransferase Ste14